MYSIVRSNTSEQEYHSEIWPEDAVRVLNYHYAVISSRKAKEEWSSKSHGFMPTYGNCTGCYKSGPLGKYCNECKDQMAGYVILTKHEKILDLIMIAEISNKNQETVM